MIRKINATAAAALSVYASTHFAWTITGSLMCVALAVTLEAAKLIAVWDTVKALRRQCGYAWSAHAALAAVLAVTSIAATTAAGYGDITAQQVAADKAAADAERAAAFEEEAMARKENMERIRLAEEMTARGAVTRASQLMLGLHQAASVSQQRGEKPQQVNRFALWVAGIVAVLLEFVGIGAAVQAAIGQRAAAPVPAAAPTDDYARALAMCRAGEMSPSYRQVIVKLGVSERKARAIAARLKSEMG